MAVDDDHVLCALEVHDGTRVTGQVAGLDRVPLAVRVQVVAHHGTPDRHRVGRSVRTGGGEPVTAGRAESISDALPREGLFGLRHGPKPARGQRSAQAVRVPPRLGQAEKGLLRLPGFYKVTGDKSP